MFAPLNAVFDFALDAAANDSNFKVPNYITEAEDGLKVSWHERSGGAAVWLNPPWSKKPWRPIKPWILKAIAESQHGITVVVLMPSRTDTEAFEIASDNASARLFIKGRVTFVGKEHPAPFPCMLAVFGPCPPNFGLLGDLGEILLAATPVQPQPANGVPPEETGAPKPDDIDEAF